jgi:hypothetical protein
MASQERTLLVRTLRPPREGGVFALHAEGGGAPLASGFGVGRLAETHRLNKARAVTKQALKG